MSLAEADSALVKDPVCGMSVDPATAKHRAEHAGATYYFCSAGCRGKFVAEPAKYLGAVGAVADRAGRAPKGVRKNARLMTGYRARLVLSFSRLIRQGWTPPTQSSHRAGGERGWVVSAAIRKDCFVV